MGTVCVTRYKALFFCTIVFFFVVAATIYQSSAAVATAAVLVLEGPSPEPLPLRPVLLSDLHTRLQGFWGRIPCLPSPQWGRLLAAVSGRHHCVRYYRGFLDPGCMTGEGTGDGVEALAFPALSPRGRAHRSREMGIIVRGGREFCPRGEGGGLSPRKRRQNTLHYVRAPPRRGLENGNPYPIRHHP